MMRFNRRNTMNLACAVVALAALFISAGSAKAQARGGRGGHHGGAAGGRVGSRHHLPQLAQNNVAGLFDGAWGWPSYYGGYYDFYDGGWDGTALTAFGIVQYTQYGYAWGPPITFIPFANDNSYNW